MPTLEGETTLQRYQREVEIDEAISKRLAEKAEAHATFHRAQIQLEAEAALKQINQLTCFAARSIGQIRRHSKGLAQNGKHDAQ